MSQSATPAPTPAPQPQFDSAIVARVRQSITDYLQQNIVSSPEMANVLTGPPDIPQFTSCPGDYNKKPVGSLIMVARARVLDAQPLGQPRFPSPDSMSVLAELFVVARATEADTTWEVKQDVSLDSVRLTLVEKEGRWGLCWPGHEAADFPGPPFFVTSYDSSRDDFHWHPPLSSWASLRQLADSVRWKRVAALENDSAVKRAIASGDFSDRLGVVDHTREGTTCLTIADSTLPAGTPILVFPEEETKSAVRGAIEARRARECMKGSDEWGSVVMKSASYYDVVFPPGVTGGGIVVAARPTAVREAKGVVSIDIDGDGHPESLESCQSHEGTHYFVSTRKGKQKIQRWETYIYVPYDLEPNCGKKGFDSGL